MAVLITFYIVITFLSIYLCMRKKPLDHIPGPPALPFLGNILQINREIRSSYFLRLSKKYGKIYRLYFPRQNVVIVSSPKEIKEVLFKQNENFADRPITFRAKLITGFNNIFMTPFSEEVKWRRKIMHSSFHQYGSGMKRIENFALTRTQKLIDELKCKDGQVVDIAEMVKNAIIDIVMLMINGEMVIPDEDKLAFNDLVKRLGKSFGNGTTAEYIDMFPWLSYLNNIDYKTILEANLYRDTAIPKQMEAMKAKGNDGHGFVKTLVTLPPDIIKEYNVTNDVIINLINEAVFASISTTSNVLSQMMNVLAHHPAIQEKLQEEVDSVIGESRLPTLEDREYMPYLEATIHELLRHMSLNPMGFPRCATNDTSLSGYHIPKGTTVWVNLWTMHHDEKLFPDPFKFDPERYLDADGMLVPCDHPNRINTMPFGAGVRTCVGEIFARRRLFLVIGSLMKEITILPETTLEEQPSCDPHLHTHGLSNTVPVYKVRVISRHEHGKKQYYTDCQ